jgi:hypothetical protein
MPRTLYIVVEHFKNKDAVGVCIGDFGNAAAWPVAQRIVRLFPGLRRRLRNFRPNWTSQLDSPDWAVHRKVPPI